MVPGQKNIILRYTLIVFIMALLAIAIIAKRQLSCLQSGNTGKMWPTVLSKKM